MRGQCSGGHVADRNLFPHSDCVTYTRANGHAYIDRHAHSHTRTGRAPLPHSDCVTYTRADGHAYTDRHSHTNPDTHGHANTYAHAYTNA